MNYFDDIRLVTASRFVTRRNSELSVSIFGGIGVMLRGPAILMTPEDSRIVETPFLYVIRSGDSFCWKTPPKVERENVWISAEGMRFTRMTNAVYSMTTRGTRKLDMSSALTIARQIDMIRKVFEFPSIDRNKRCAVLMEELIFAIYQVCAENESSDPVRTKILAAAQNMTEKPSEPCDFWKTAAECGVCRQYFALLFRKYIGTSPYEFLLDARLMLAKRLLRDRKGSIKEIGYECGFSSQNDFSRFFKKKTGMTPREFAGIEQY